MTTLNDALPANQDWLPLEFPKVLPDREAHWTIDDEHVRTTGELRYEWQDVNRRRIKVAVGAYCERAVGGSALAAHESGAELTQYYPDAPAPTVTAGPQALTLPVDTSVNGTTGILTIATAGFTPPDAGTLTVTLTHASGDAVIVIPFDAEPEDVEAIVREALGLEEGDPRIVGQGNWASQPINVNLHADLGEAFLPLVAAEVTSDDLVGVDLAPEANIAGNEGVPAYAADSPIGTLLFKEDGSTIYMRDHGNYIWVEIFSD